VRQTHQNDAVLDSLAGTDPGPFPSMQQVAASLALLFAKGASGDEAVRLSRHVNEYAIDLMRTHPQQFGFFASLPLPDMHATIDELRFGRFPATVATLRHP